MFSFLYVEPKSKVEKANAAVPLLVPIIGSVFLDVAVDAGIQFVDDKMAKAKADAFGKKMWDKYGDNLKDLKPTKKNAGKWALKIPKWLMAEMVDEVGDLSKEVVKKDADRKKKNKDVLKSEIRDAGDLDPFYNTAVDITIAPDSFDNNLDKRLYAYFTEWKDWYLVPNAFGESSNVYICDSGVSYSSTNCATIEKLPGGEHTLLIEGDNNYPGGYNGYIGYWNRVWYGKQILMETYDKPYYHSQKAFMVYLKQLEDANKKIYYGDGILTTDGYDGFISLPEDIDYDDLQKVDFDKLPPKYKDEVEFEWELDASLGLDLSDILDGAEFDWDRIEQDIQIKIENGDIYYQYIFNYNPTINNDYEISDDDQNDIDTILPPSTGGGKPPSIGDGSGGGMVCTEDGKIIPCEKVEKIDGSLLAYVKNAYEYATGFVKTATDGLKALGTGAVELTKLYGVFFGWLPKEIVVLMSSGLAIMLGLRIFRK